MKYLNYGWLMLCKNRIINIKWSRNLDWKQNEFRVPMTSSMAVHDASPNIYIILNEQNNIKIEFSSNYAVKHTTCLAHRANCVINLFYMLTMAAAAAAKTCTATSACNLGLLRRTVDRARDLSQSILSDIYDKSKILWQLTRSEEIYIYVRNIWGFKGNAFVGSFYWK